VLRFVQRVATKNGVTAEQLMMGTLVDEDIDSNAPVFLFYRVDPEGNTALLATQDNGPYRSHLSGARDDRQLDDPLISGRADAEPRKGELERAPRAQESEAIWLSVALRVSWWRVSEVPPHRCGLRDPIVVIPCTTFAAPTAEAGASVNSRARTIDAAHETH
jgi:hypothetical protein